MFRRPSLRPTLYPARLALALTLALVAPLALQAQSSQERGPVLRAAGTDAAMARVIVRFKPDGLRKSALATGSRGELRNAAALSQRAGITLADGPSVDARTQVVKAVGVSSETLARQLAALEDVEEVHVDRRRTALAAPNDPYYAGGAGVPVPAGQWYLRPPTSTFVSAVNAEQAWDITTGSPNVVVAVLDTGVRKDHPDLVGKLVDGYDFIAADSPGVFTTANDGDGRDADPSDPGDWDATFDSSWHGTQTAGLIGASTNNGVGIAGAGRNVRVQPVRVLGSGGGYDSDIQAGMLWAAGIAVPGVPTNATPAKVINMSLGGSSNSCGNGYPAIISQILARNVVIVASAGNDGKPINEPANCAGVVGVAGIRHTGTKVGYSSLGPEAAIAAPAGNCVNDASGPCLYPLMTTSNAGLQGPGANIYTGTGANASIGTSFSAPLVSATAALMFSANRQLTPAQVTSLLKTSARAFPSSGAGPTVVACQAPSSTAQDECYCTTTTCGAGMLNAQAAVDAAAALVQLTADFTTTANPLTVGSSAVLDAADSQVPRGRTITQYQWSITSGSTSATFASGATTATGATATLAATAAGTVTVALTITDSTNASSTAERSITIAAAGTGGGGGGSGSTGSGGGGGGALGFGWLLALAGGVAALRRRRG